MSDLVKTNPFMEHGDLNQQVAAVRGLQEWVRTAGAEEAADASDTARKARDVIKALDGAEELAREATRLELMALRRLGQLGQAKLAGPTRARAARGFAEMDDAEFAAVVADAEAWRSGLAIWQSIKRKRDWQDDKQRGREVGGGTPLDPVPVEVSDLSALADSAASLLHFFTAEGRAFSVSEVAEDIAEQFGLSWENHAIREGLREVVRHAIQSESHVASVGDEIAQADAGVDPDDIVRAGAPPFVTYFEDEAGWVRVPWRSASMEQLRYMVELRELQAAQMRRVADHLRLLFQMLQSVEVAGPTGYDKCSYRLADLDEKSAYRLWLSVRSGQLSDASDAA